MESAIWSLNKNTKQVSRTLLPNNLLSSATTYNHTAQWINPDGSSPPTTLAYDIREVRYIPARQGVY